MQQRRSSFWRVSMFVFGQRTTVDTYKQQPPQLEGVVVRPLPTKINSQASLSNVLLVLVKLSSVDRW